MPTRIRYTKVDWGYVSNDLIGNGIVLRALINSTDNSFFIVEPSTNLILKAGDAKTMQSLKTKIKNELKALGVRFSDEVRKKRS